MAFTKGNNFVEEEGSKPVGEWSHVPLASISKLHIFVNL